DYNARGRASPADVVPGKRRWSGRKPAGRRAANVGRGMMRRNEAHMNPTGRLLSVFVFAALAAGLVQADARERGARHGAHPPRSVGQPHPSPAGTATARPNTSHATHAVKPPSFSVPGPPGNAVKHMTRRPGALETLKKSAV